MFIWTVNVLNTTHVPRTRIWTVNVLNRQVNNVSCLLLFASSLLSFERFFPFLLLGLNTNFLNFLNPKPMPQAPKPLNMVSTARPFAFAVLGSTGICPAIRKARYVQQKQNLTFSTGIASMLESLPWACRGVSPDFSHVFPS